MDADVLERIERIAHRRWGVDQHAIDNYHRFYPEASTEDIQWAMHLGDHIDGTIARGFSGGYDRPGDAIAHVLHPERTGLFLVVRNRGWKGAITFTRFYARHQHDVAVQLFGPGDLVTACRECRWADEVLAEQLEALAALTAPDPA